MKCKDCSKCTISHEDKDGYIYMCKAVTTGNGGTTHPIIDLENEDCYLKV